MTDWYQFFTGRPNPGRRSDREFRRYIDGGENAEEVNRTAAAVEAGRNRPLPEVGYRNLPERERPRREPLITGEDIGAAVGDVGGYIADYAEDGVPQNRYRRRDAAPVRSEPRMREDLEDPSQVSVGNRTPFSALTGDDVEPFGDDFMTWYNATRYRPLPPALRAEDEPGSAINPETNPGREPNNRNNIPLGVEGGTRRVPTRLEMGANDHAPTVERSFGALPSPEQRFDPTQAWIDAEERAGVRWREGKPNITDQIFAAIFGQRAIPQEDLEEARSAANRRRR